MDPVDRRILLTLHPRVGRWLQTGGHLEPGDRDLLDAARREAAEESGIEGLRLREQPLRLDRHAVPCRDVDGAVAETHHLDVQFLALAPRGARSRISAESLDLRWWPLAGPPRVDASVEALISAAVAAM